MANLVGEEGSVLEKSTKLNFVSNVVSETLELHWKIREFERLAAAPTDAQADLLPTARFVFQSGDKVWCDFFFY
jgi:hypothetical protein